MLIFGQKIIKLPLIVLVVIILLALTELLYAANSLYSPYPVIFVHGVNSDITAWNYTKGQLEIYFKNQNDYKYFHDNRDDYFPYCDYGWQNNGSIPNIAVTSLRGSIEVALKSFPSEVPESERKVIIIAHSLGGLVVRSLLKQDLSGYYASKIDKVIFLGTPHLGVPSASALWLLKELNEATLDNLITKYSKFYSASAFTGFKYKPINYSPYVFSTVGSRLATLKTNIAILLKAAKAVGPDPDGIALEQLRLAGDVNYHTTILDFSTFQFIREDISLGHSGSETFLGQNNLNTPSNYKTIRGVNNYGGKISAWSMSQLLDNFSNNFTFPVLNGELQSLENAKDIGDGIVTKASQEGLKEADYSVQAFHIPLLWIKGEVEAYDTILQAIDDKPVIESVRAVPVDWNKPNVEFYGPWSYLISQEYYLIFKVKDYLLADIEIESLTIDGTNPSVDLSMFEADGKYKPYNYRRDEKAFLKERDDKTATFKNIKGEEEYLKDLKPGEFWVKATIPANATQAKLRIKNPATEYDAEKFTAERTFYITEPSIANIDWGPYWPAPLSAYAFIDVPPYDYSPLYDEKGNIIVLHYYPSSASRYLDLSFSIVNSPYSEVRCNVWLYNLFFKTLWKKFCTNKVVTLSGSQYSGVVNDIPRWYGDKEGGGYIEGYDVFNTDFEHDPTRYNMYRLVVTVEATNDDPKDDILPLLGLSLGGGFRGTILCADPTFIQAPRREGVSW